MSASSKFGSASSSPDGFLYASGLRGSLGASMDRSNSFRESLDSPALPAHPNTTRAGSAPTQGDISAFLQCLRFDPKQMVTNHKLNRPVDFKHLACLSLGVPPEDSSSMPSKCRPISSPSPEEFRRLKAALRESCTKARERAKVFNESLSGMNKLFPSVPSRKRSWSNASSNDRSSSLCSADGPVSGTVSKVGSKSLTSPYDIEVELKSEERVKGVSIKRTRSSTVDARMDAKVNLPARPSEISENNREVLKSPNTSTVQSGNRTLTVAVDRWENTKMKKKRSGIKSEVMAISLPTKPLDGSRETKRGMQQLPRMNDIFSVRTSCRPGVTNGGDAKVDDSLPQMRHGKRASGPRNEPDKSSVLHENQGRTFAKEVNLKAINKTSAREDLTTGSPTSSTKLNVTSRAPRSGSKVGHKLSNELSRATSTNDWEVSQSTSKLAAAVGTNIRKRTTSVRSSSPPVGQWASHRPLKTSRTASRTNSASLGQSSHECSPETTSLSESERCLFGSSPHMGKSRTEQFSSSGLSESEESEHSDLKPKKKIKQSDGMDYNSGQNVQKAASLMLPPRETKIVNREELGDGVRRQGRSGRGFTPRRPSVPVAVKKYCKVGLSKQLRCVRNDSDTESKISQLSTRTLSDHKAYSRQKDIMAFATTDFLDDGHVELLVATDAVINQAQAHSCSLWRQMEPSFRFIAEVDLAFLKQQINLKPTMTSLAVVPSGSDKPNSLADSFRLGNLGSGVKRKCDGNSQQILPSQIKTVDEIPLYQRLMAALIPEEDIELCGSQNVDLRFDFHDSGFGMDIDVTTDDPQILRKSNFSGHPTSNGCRIDVKGGFFNETEHVMHEDNVMSFSDNGFMHGNFQKGLHPGLPLNGSICSEFQYNNMSITERLLLEVHCIGIFPEAVPDLLHSGDGEIAEEITKLNEKYLEKVSSRKSLLDRLLKSADEMRVLQERKFEEDALDKLVGMAYEKYTACLGPNAHGMKSGSGRIVKQSALAFVERTLDRCKEFENTGKSCFDQPLFKNMFLSGVSQLGNEHTTDSRTKTPGGSLDIRGSASQNHGRYSSENILSVNLAIEKDFDTEETWSSSRVVKTKELYLDDVGGSFLNIAKGKRSERDLKTVDGLSKNGTTKKSRSKSSSANNMKGEKKSSNKPKSKQKTTQLSGSVNGRLLANEKISSNNSLSRSNTSVVAKNEVEEEDEELEDPIDLSNLQIPDDDLGVPGELGEEGQDIGSWLNIDDEDVGMQDVDDFMGLQIPMDDLSDLKMMV